MKKISTSLLSFIPASHENKKTPGSVKKIIFTQKDFHKNITFKMVNWARILPGKSFNRHYHEDMDEIFIILSGKAEIRVGESIETLVSGDAVLVPMRKVHTMKDISGNGVDYLVIGLSLEKNGTTVMAREKL